MKLCVALPIYGSLHAETAQCLHRLLMEPPCDLKLAMNLGDSLVSRSRNTLTADFLETDCTDMLFIDSDLIFSPDHVRRIASHDLDVVGGFYPKKQEGPVQWVCNCLDGKQPPPDPKTSLQQVKYIGTGFMRVRRIVFELMREQWGDVIGYVADGTKRKEYDYWTVGVHRFHDGTRRYLSEDWYFCQRWLDMGGLVWADAGIVLKHLGQAAYPLKSQCIEAGLPV